ncbi:MAG: class I SAM-dependent methyltransferase [Candidatus Thiodiazotropha endolucinida]
MPHRWCNSAQVRRTQIESGIDITFNEVFQPLFIQKISELSPKHVLEVGAGTGHLSKAVSNLGYKVTAIEPSPGMYKTACDVLRGSDVHIFNIASQQITEVEEFDLAFSHLVAHVVDDLREFLLSLIPCIKKGGHFIFSIPHPCFYNEYKNFFGEEYNYMTSMSKEISFTITNDTKNIIEGVPYHHRPLSDYINSLVGSGFVVDGFLETYPEDDVQMLYGAMWEFPRYCAFVCKKL